MEPFRPYEKPEMEKVTLDAPWSQRELWRGFALAIGLYLIGSFIGGALLVRLGLRESPWLGPILAFVQGMMILPPLVIIARHGSVVSLLGLDRFNWRMLLETGATLGIAFCSMMLYGVLLLPFGLRAQEPIVPLFGEGAGGLVSVFIVGAILAPIAEEIVFRGFLFAGLRQQRGLRTAVLVSGALFALLHLQPLAFPVLFLLGVLLAFLYHRTGSLWAPIAMHFCINSAAILAQYAAAQQGLI